MRPKVRIMSRAILSPGELNDVYGGARHSTKGLVYGQDDIQCNIRYFANNVNFITRTKDVSFTVLFVATDRLNNVVAWCGLDFGDPNLRVDRDGES